MSAGRRSRRRSRPRTDSYRVPSPSRDGDTERRVVSVLFVDLVGFTTFSEGRDAEDVRAMLTHYFDAASDAVQRHGGTVEKFIGDAVMAVWGTPVAHEDDAERAVRSALEIVDRVEALGASLALNLKARAGVLTGEAVAVLDAVDQGFVTGDLVNTASRLQSAAAPGTVLVGERTYRSVAESIACVPVEPLSLKGKAEQVPAWQALRVISEMGGSNRGAAPEPPFGGRDEELRLAKELLHATGREGRPRLLHITGVAGIGKSRLVWELQKYVDGLTETFFWHQGRCPSYGEGVDVLGACGDGPRTRADRRHRRRRDRARPADELASSSTSPTPRNDAGSSRGSDISSASTGLRETATSSSGPGGGSSSGSPSTAPRCSSSRTCTGPTRVCSTSSSRCWSGAVRLR